MFLSFKVYSLIQTIITMLLSRDNGLVAPLTTSGLITAFGSRFDECLNAPDDNLEGFSSVMFAKHTLNHPGSLQWHNDPSEMFSLTLYTFFFHSSICASIVLKLNRCLMLTRENSPALPLRPLMPAFWRQKKT